METPKPKIKYDIANSEDVADNLDMNDIWCIRTEENTGKIIDITRVTPEWVEKHLK